MSTSQTWCTQITGGLLRMQILTWEVCGGAWDSAFLTSSLVMLRLRLCSAHIGSQALDHDSQNWFDFDVLKSCRRLLNIPL